MKIYFIRLENTPFGGAETYLSRLTDALKQRDIAFQIIHGTAPKFLASWLKALWLSLQTSLTKGHKFYFSLARIARPDIYRAGDGVHRAYMKALNKKFWQNPLHLTYCYLEKKCFHHAKLIIANSRMVKQEIIEHYNVPDEKIRVIYNGINLPTFDREASKLKICAEFHLPKNQKIILFVGSGFQRKGVDAFLKIVSRLSFNFTALIVGKDRHIAAYRKKAQQLNIGFKVIFTGLRSDLSDFYAASDIFLFPALYEPFPNVVLEALSFENVVFCSRQTGAAELLDSHYHINEIEDTAEKIDALFQDKNKLQSARLQARAMATHYSMDKNVNETLEAVQALMDSL